MKVQTTAGQLRAGLHLFRGVIQRRNTIPVLGAVRFADGRLTGTDLDMEVTVALPSVGKMEGEAVIDWASLRALSGCVDADEVMTVSEAAGRASISFNGSEYSMPSIAVSDFPDFQQPEGSRSAIGNIGLIDAMRRIRFAISREDTRYYLNGVALLVDAERRPLIAATDGHRMAYQMLDAMPDGAAGAIIPRDLMHYLCSLKAAPDFCTFDTERNRVSFELPGMTVAAKLIDGKFPDIFRVIPKDPKPVFSIARQPLLRALMRMRAFHSGGSFRAVKLEGGGQRTDADPCAFRIRRERGGEAAADRRGGSTLRGRLQCRLPDFRARGVARRRSHLRYAREHNRRSSRHHLCRRRAAHRADADARVRAA